MKKHLLFLILSAITYVAYPQTFDPLSHLDNPYNFEMRNAEKLMEAAQKGVGSNYDLKYHRFEWTVDPDTCYISGKVTSYFVTRASGFTTVSFELSSGMSVDSVKYHGNNLTFSHANDQLDINLGTTLAAGILDSVHVWYQGNPQAGSGFGSFIKDVHNGTPVIWTLSEPYGAREWWPCKSILSDKIDSIDVIVTTPQAYRVASNGKLISETLSGSNKIYHWKHRYPIAAYLIAIAVTNYAAYSDYVPLGQDTLQMLNYVYPEDLAAFQNATPYQVGVLQLYDSLYGDYPYMKEKYGHAEFGWGGGMEHQTMSFVINSSFDLLAHEMAHQWYGDKVTCNSWHDIWVNEGFATYSQGLTLEHFWNGQYWPDWLLNHINSITSLPDGSVYCYDTTEVNRVFDWRLTYEKGAMVLHMLRWIMGDDDFFQGMKNIIADPLIAYGYAGTADIKRNFENASGLNLSEFFNDWIYGQGFPVYNISVSVQPDFTTNVTIQQTPSHSSVSFFELPVPIRFKDATHDTILVFNNTFSGQSFTANPGFMPDSVLFDPEHKLVAHLDTLSVTLNVPQYATNNLTISPNPANNYINLNNMSDDFNLAQIFSPDGRLQLSIPLQRTTHFRLDISTLKAGAYLLKLVSPYTTTTCHFVKI